MSAALGLLSFGRRFGRQTMLSTIVIRRNAGEELNRGTGKLEKTWETIYDGPAEIKLREALPRDVDAVGQRLAEQTPSLKLPIEGPHAADAANVRVDDVGEITANPPDEAIVGLRVRVSGYHGQTLATGRRLPIEVLSHA